MTVWQIIWEVAAVLAAFSVLCWLQNRDDEEEQ
jgi:hypothetical protein